MIWILPMVVLVVQLMRWLNSRPVMASCEPPQLDARQTRSVTFLVAAWNAAEDVEPFVKAFRALNLPSAQLVLAAGGEDGTYERAVSLSDAQVTVILQRAGEGKQRALANAFPYARGTIIYLTDIDCRPTRDVVNPMLLHLDTAPQEVAAGMVRPLESQVTNRFVLAQWAVYQASRMAESSSVTGIDGRNAAVRRDILVATRALEVPAPSGTDYTLAKELLRRGFVIRRVCSEMPTEFPPTFGTYVKKQARWLRNVWLLGGRYRALREVRQVALTVTFPLAVVALMLVGVWLHQALALALALVLWSLGNRTIYLKKAGVAPYLWANAMLLGGDWSASLLMLIQIWRGSLAWS
ncbi:MAG: glycosyltransferase [Firmicutes bacterium]|nr:glycosyltransferase [Bacillota bacterium]